MKQNSFGSKRKTNKLEGTEDTLTGRGGLALLVRAALHWARSISKSDTEN